MIGGLYEFSEERPYIVIGAVVLVSLLMVYGATNVSMSSEMERFLPEKYVSVQVSNEVENVAGKRVSETVLVEGDNLLSPESFKTMEQLTSGISNSSSLENCVTQINSYLDYLLPSIERRMGDLENIPGERLEHALNLLLSRPSVKKQVGSYLSEENRAALVNVSLDPSLSKTELYEGVRNLRDYVENFERNHEGLELGTAGNVSMELDTQGLMRRDNMILIPSAIIVVIVILYLAFRRFSDTSLPFLVLGIGALWMVGVMGYFGITFNMIFVALIPILLGIGIDYTIHMLNRYYEERGKGLSSRVSAINSVKTVGVAIFLTAVTTTIGFASFGISDMPPIRDFGIMAGVGVLFVFVLATTFLPSLLTLRDRDSEAQEEGEEKTGGTDRVGRALSKVEMGVNRYGKPILVVAVVLAGLSVIPAFGISTTMSYDTFLPNQVESVRTMNEIQDYFGGMGFQSNAFLLVRGNFSEPSNLRKIEELQESITSASDGDNLISGSSSIVNLIKFTGRRGIPRDRERVRKMLNVLKNRHPEQHGSLVLGENKTVVYFSLNVADAREMREATEIIRDGVENFIGQNATDLDLTTEGEPSLSGPPVIFSDIMKSLKPSMEQSIALAIILVVVVISLVFRSIWIGLIGAIPVSFALVWEIGFLGAMGWPLDVMNMMVSAIAIGIGVDFAIHITDRFKEERSENGKSPEEAISITIRSVGRAITAAASTTIGVFLILSLSRMPPIARFGQLSALVIFFSLVGALLVLPSALLFYARRKEI